LQLQDDGTHWQVSPHGQLEAGAPPSVLVLWQPHWHAAAAQELHLHWVELVMVGFLSIWLG